MKHMNLLLLVLALLGGTATLRAYDFEANGIYYSITDQDAATVSVTAGDDKYSGDVTIPASVSHDGKSFAVTAIGGNAFQACSDLTSVVMPEGIEAIGNYAFSGCANLAAIVIPKSVRQLGREAFSHCASLAAVTFSEGLETVGTAAFISCISLTSITIPASVTSIGERAFASCSGLTAIEVREGNKNYDSRGGCNAIVRTASNTLVAGCQSTVIPEGIESIGSDAFYSCSGLTSVTIPASVTSIGDLAFMGCIGLVSVKVAAGNTKYDSRNECNAIIETAANTLTVGCQSTVIPGTVTHIGKNAFYGCSNLTTLDIPEGVTSVGDNAFLSCSLLASVTFPRSMEQIGSRAFCFCSSLKDVYCRTAKVPSTSTDAFDYSNTENATLHVYDFTYDAFSSTEPWSGFGNIVTEKEVKPCAKPTIAFAGGKLTFKCETEGVTFNYDIADDDVKSGTGSEISLTATYLISVYASKEDCYDSQVATATLCWIAVEPQTEGLTDEDAVAEVKALPVLIQNEGGVITVQGAGNGTEVSVYGLGGKRHASMISTGGSVTLDTALPAGSVAVVKIGETAVKVLLK